MSAKHSGIRSPCLSELPSIFGNALCLHTPAPAEGEAFGENRGARGELFPPHAFPAFLSFLSFLSFLPFLPFRGLFRLGGD